jgi:hypothetical protein
VRALGVADAPPTDERPQERLLDGLLCLSRIVEQQRGEPAQAGVVRVEERRDRGVPPVGHGRQRPTPEPDGNERSLTHIRKRRTSGS